LQMVRHRFSIYASIAELPWRYVTRSWALQTRYTLRRNTASILKCLIRLKEFIYCCLSWNFCPFTTFETKFYWDSIYLRAFVKSGVDLSNQMTINRIDQQNDNFNENLLFC